MLRLRSLLPLLAVIVGWVMLPAAAQASGYDPSGFHFSSANYTVHESSGRAVITVVRADTSAEAYAYYVAVGIGHQCGSAGCTAIPPDNISPADFGAAQGVLDFPAGVAAESFTVPIYDHHFATIPKTFQVSLFNSYPIGRANPNQAVVTILDDDATAARAANNPLDLPVAPTNGDPLSGARFYIDHQSKPWVAMKSGNPGLWPIAYEPGAARFGSFSGPDVGLAVNRFLVTAATTEPGTVPMLATYRIVDGHCGNYTPSPADVASYHNWVSSFAAGIGSYRAVLFLEMDSIITTPCLSQQGVAIRMGELHDAINVLTADCPHLVIYLDAGAGDAIPAGEAANLLRQAGIAKIQGFFLNSTHFDWTSKEIRFGEKVSKLTGGKHFVINTGENGRGPLAPPDPVHQGNEVLCNPPGRGLGPKPTANTGYVNVDAFAWTSTPGESGGQCVPGAPPTGDYWPAYGLMLIRNADYAVDSRAAIARWARGGHAARKRPAPKHKKHVVKHHKARKHSVRQPLARAV